MGSQGRRRNQWTCVWCAALLCALALPIEGQAVTALSAVRVASGLSAPVFVTAPPGDYGRLFIVRQSGRVHILNLATGVVNPTPFLDINARISTTGEQGLLGLAFDPDYASNGKFYANFVVPGGVYGQGVTHVSQFKVSANPDVADTSQEKILLTFDQPQSNHNGGWIGFSPRPGDDHNLYVATGDGGNGNDTGTGHIEPGGNAQNLMTLLGKMLRIHIDPIAGTACIPANNPFAASTSARPEIFCLGLRNPFRCGFDRLTGNLFIGDVGQSTREEVDVQRAANPGGGENFGWRVREGTVQNPVYPSDPIPSGAVDPIFDYPRSTGGTVIGGPVYRGRQIPALRGTYVFGDYLSTKIFTLNYYDGATASNFQTITAQLFPTANGGFTLANPVSIGEDANGELYIADIGNGSIFKIVPVTPNVTPMALSHVPGGSAFISGFGVPFKTHTVEFTDTLVQQFGFLATTTAGGDGALSYEDQSAATQAQRFYRFTYP